MDKTRKIEERLNITYGRGYAYYLKYHLLWCTNNLAPIFEGDIKTSCEKILHDMADKYRFKIDKLEIARDYIYMKVDCKPQFHISDMIKILKGNIARWLFMDYPKLKEKTPDGKLWTVSYLAIIDSIDADMKIKEYLFKQKGRLNE